MLTKTILGLILFTLPLMAEDDLIAAAKSDRKPTKKQVATPFSPSFFIKGNYLLWKPYEDNLDVYFKVVSVGESNAVGAVIQQPDFEWGSGGRMTLGGYIDHWDLSLTATYMPGSASKESSADFGNTQSSIQSIIFSLYESPLLAAISHAKTSWNMDYITIDALVGRAFFPTSKVEFHPFLGLRYMRVNQTLSSKFNSRYIVLDDNQAPIFDEIKRTKNRFNFDVDGIGPRVGFDFAFWIMRRWELLASASGSIVYGFYNMRLKTIGNSIPSESPPITIRPFNLDFKKDHQALRTNIEGFIGFGYKKTWHNSLKVFTAKALVEAVNWFNLNTTSDFQTRLQGVRVGSDISETFRTGNLTLFGMTLELGFEF